MFLSEILETLKYYFRLCLKAIETAFMIQKIEKNEIISDYTIQNCFKCFKSVEIKSRNGLIINCQLWCFKIQGQKRTWPPICKISWEEQELLKDMISRTLCKLRKSFRLYSNKFSYSNISATVSLHFFLVFATIGNLPGMSKGILFKWNPLFDPKEYAVLIPVTMFFMGNCRTCCY